jgi:hypothetical protein
MARIPTWPRHHLERIGVGESIAAMILRHTNERVSRKHYSKLALNEARAAMALLSEAFSNVGSIKLLPKRLKNRKTLLERAGCSRHRVDVNVCN